LLAESLEISRKIDNKMLQNEVLRALGEISEAKQDYGRAVDLCKESLAIIQELHDVTNISVLYFNIGRASQLAGENRKAKDYFMDALQWSRRLGKQEGILRALGGLGVVAAVHDDAQCAVRLLIASQALYTNLGFKFPPNQFAWFAHHLKAARAQLDEEQFAAALAEGKKMTLEQALDLALKTVEEM
jgi:tetratricopeptide (TPR) repeat protein